MVEKADSRVMKYRHVMGESMELDTPEIAVISVLMLRGPQTVGEIRTRSSRMFDFQSLGDVEITLKALMVREPALAARLPRQTGQKEVRYAHLLCGEVVPVDEADSTGNERFARLEQADEELRREVDELKRQFEQFKKQFE